MISAIGCVFRALRSDKEYFVNITFSNIKRQAKKYSNFPKYSLPAQLLNTVGVQMPILFLGFYFGNTEVGFFSMTSSVLSIPISVISIAVRDSFRQQASIDYKLKGECRTLYIKTLKPLFIIAFVATIGIVFFIPDLFVFILGKQWEISGVYSQILLPMIALSFISNSLGGVLIITEKLKVSMYWQIYYRYYCSSLLLGLFYLES